MRSCNFGNILPIKVPKNYEGKVNDFFTKLQSRQMFSMWNPVFTLLVRILLKSWTLLFKQYTVTAKTVSQLKSLEERKRLILTLEKKDLVWNCQYRIGTIFRNECWQQIWSDCEKKRTSQTWICFRHCPHTLSYDKYRRDWIQNCWWHKSSITALLSLCSKAQSRRNQHYSTVPELSVL